MPAAEESVAWLRFTSDHVALRPGLIAIKFLCVDDWRRPDIKDQSFGSAVCKGIVVMIDVIRLRVRTRLMY